MLDGSKLYLGDLCHNTICLEELTTRNLSAQIQRPDRMTPFVVVHRYRHSGGTCYVHLQGNFRELSGKLLYCKIQAAGFSKILEPIYQTARYHFPGGKSLYLQSWNNKSHI